MVGGPFHALLRRLQLLGADRLPTWRAALLLALVVWLPAAVVALVEAFAGWRGQAGGAGL